MQDTIHSIARKVGTFHHNAAKAIAKVTGPIATALHKLAG